MCKAIRFSDVRQLESEWAFLACKFSGVRAKFHRCEPVTQKLNNFEQDLSLLDKAELASSVGKILHN